MTKLAALSGVIDQPSFVLTFLPLIISLCFIIGGFYIIRGNAFWTALWSNVKWEQALRAWDITIEQNEDSIVLHDVKQYWRVIRGYSLIGAGTLMLLATLALIGIAMLIPKLSLLETTLNSGLSAATWIFALLVGYIVGYAWGVENIRRTTTHGMSYADIRQRRASDYCSPLVRTVPVLLVVYNVIVAFLVQPYLTTPLLIPLAGGSQLELTKGPLVVSGIPVLMALTVIMIELFLARVVALPRVVATPHPATAQRIDDMIRSVSIAQLLCFEMLIVSALTFAQFSLVLPDSTAPVYISILQFVSWLLAAGFQLGGILLNVCRGQLGGSISGWWWRAKGNVA